MFAGRPKKTRILVLGGGVLGSAVQRAGWLKGFDACLATRTARGAWEPLDISKNAGVERFFEERGPFSAVINCSAASHVDGCEADPENARAVNALGVRHLALACRNRKAALLHVSTDYVFSGTGRKPLEVSDPCAPRSIYGMTKLEGEYYALTVPGVSAVVRTTWLFGASKNDFVNGVIEKARQGGPLAAIADQEASPTYSKDLAGALGRITNDFLLPRLGEGKEEHRVYHVTNRGITTRHGMAEKIAELVGRKQSVKKIVAGELAAWLAVRPRYTAMAGGAFERDFGMRLRPWEEALEEYVNGTSA